MLRDLTRPCLRIGEMQHRVHTGASQKQLSNKKATLKLPSIFRMFENAPESAGEPAVALPREIESLGKRFQTLQQAW